MCNLTLQYDPLSRREKGAPDERDGPRINDGLWSWSSSWVVVGFNGSGTLGRVNFGIGMSPRRAAKGVCKRLVKGPSIVVIRGSVIVRPSAGIATDEVATDDDHMPEQICDDDSMACPTTCLTHASFVCQSRPRYARQSRSQYALRPPMNPSHPPPKTIQHSATISFPFLHFLTLPALLFNLCWSSSSADSIIAKTNMFLLAKMNHAA